MRGARTSAIGRRRPLLGHRRAHRTPHRYTFNCDEPLIRQMRTHFDDAVVTGWEGLDGTYGLPDPDDEHVLAAAVLGGAGAIVTWNTKDFPDACLLVGIRAFRPPTFLCDTVSLDPRSAVRAVEEIAARSGVHGPPRTRDQLLDMLAARYRLDDVVACLRDVE